MSSNGKKRGSPCALSCILKCTSRLPDKMMLGNAERCRILSAPTAEFTSSLNTKLHNFSSCKWRHVCGGHRTAAGLGGIQADTVTIVPFHLGRSEFPQQEMEHKQKSFKNIPDMNQQKTRNICSSKLIRKQCVLFTLLFWMY